MILWIFNAIVYILGSYTILMGLIYLISSIYLVGTKPFDLLTRFGRNSWAVVTGASDGIGEGFCYELARDGFNICLISRTEEKLKRVESKIKQINPQV